MPEGIVNHTANSVTQLAEDIKQAIGGGIGSSKIVIDKVTEGDADNESTVTWHTESFLVRAWKNLKTFGKYGAVEDTKVALAFKELVENGASDGKDVAQKAAANELAKIFSIETSRGNVAKKFTDAILVKSLQPLGSPSNVSSSQPHETVNGGSNHTAELNRALKNIEGAATILRDIPHEYDEVNALVTEHANTIETLKKHANGDDDVDVAQLQEGLQDFQDRLEKILTRSGGIIVNLRTGVLDALNTVRAENDQPAQESAIVNAHKARVERHLREAASDTLVARQPLNTRVTVVNNQPTSHNVFTQAKPVYKPESEAKTPTARLERALKHLETAREIAVYTLDDGPEFKRVFDANVPSQALVKEVQTVLAGLKQGAVTTPPASNIVEQFNTLASEPKVSSAVQKYADVAPALERLFQLSEDIEKGLNSNPPASRQELKNIREQATELQNQVAISVEQKGGDFDEVYAALAPFVEAIAERVPSGNQTRTTDTNVSLTPEARQKLQRFEAALEQTHNQLEATISRTGASPGATRWRVFEALNHIRAINGKEPATARTERFW